MHECTYVSTLQFGQDFGYNLVRRGGERNKVDSLKGKFQSGSC